MCRSNDNIERILENILSRFTRDRVTFFGQNPKTSRYSYSIAV